jgi:hypothetical protein
MPPGQPPKPDLAGALDLAPGTLLHCRGTRTTTVRFQALRGTLDASDPAERYTRLSVVVDHDNLHQAKAVAPWLATQPRVTRRWVPTYGPRAHPIARAWGAVHDGCTCHQQRKR